jgi:hypothetical protein
VVVELAVRVTFGLEQVSVAAEGVDITPVGATVFWVIVIAAVEVHPPAVFVTVRV